MTLEEKQAWMRSQQREKSREHRCRILAGDILASGRCDELDMRFLLAALKLRELAEDIENPSLIVEGRDRQCRPVSYRVLVLDVEPGI
jgi:hypothetical protein